MAKGLKVGDAVTVRKELRLPRKDDAYKAGLRRLKPGDIGKIVANAEGRSVIVEFDGKKVTLASQRLDLANTAEAAPQAKAGRKGANPQRAAPETRAKSEPNLIDYINIADPQFIRSVANKLLRVGDDPEAVIVQIRLSDLPGNVQDAVKGLIEKKLDLGPQPGASTGVRRGRKPKSAAS